MNAELTFLQFLQSLHSPMLDGSMCFITRLGDSGILWVTLTAVLLVFRENAAGRMCAGNGAHHRRCPLQSSSQAAGGSRPSMRHPYGGTTAYPVPGRFLLSFGPYSGVLRLGDSPLDGREKAVAMAALLVGTLIAFSRMYLCVHYPTDILGGAILGAACGWAGAWLVKKSRAPNGHPAELKKRRRDRRTAACCTAVSFVMGTRLSAGNISVFRKKPKRHAGEAMQPPPQKKK